MLPNYQHFTYYNNKETEKVLNQVMQEVATVFNELFSEQETAALIVIGGYGRGEGGIVRKNDTYHPHNNIDFLYIHHGRISQKVVALANAKLQEISKKYDIGIDMSAINRQKLLNLKGLVVSYDMRYGHKTILGDSTFLKENASFSLYNIDPTDVRQLLINRGTLLLINRVLLNKETLTTEEKKLIIKHAIKAIIGYGDALLYFNDAYHWSYAQKLTNMTEQKNIPEEVKTLYSEAMLFRFRPDYEKFLEKDLHAWNDELLHILSQIHLQCEKMNLNERDLSWDNYFTHALENRSFPKQSLRQKVKSLLFGLKHFSVLKELNTLEERLSFMQLGAKGVLALLFPYIAYNTYPEHYESLFQKIFHTKEKEANAYLKGFLTLWAKWGDTNFINVLKNYNITLEKL
jgi:hypothetical protein